MMSNSRHWRTRFTPPLRSLALLVLGAVLLASPASAARAAWFRGDADLTSGGAQRCTLEVSFDAEEVERLREWRLVWASDGGAAERLRIVASVGASALAEVCDLRPDKDGDRGARVDTAYFCSTAVPPNAARTVRYVIDVPSAAPTRIAVVPILEVDGSLRASASGVAEARINGGSIAEYPPVLAAIDYENTSDATLYRLSGAFLQDVADGHIRQAGMPSAIPLRVNARSPDAIELTGPLLERVGCGALEVRAERGPWTAFPIDWTTSGLRRTRAPRLAVKLDRSALSAGGEAMDGADRATGGVIPAVADALTRAGVVSLSPLFGGRDDEAQSRRATNVLGEPIRLAPLDDWFVATLGLDGDVAATLDVVRSTEGVREAFEDRWLYMAHVVPNDPLFNEQWGLRNPGGVVCGYVAFSGVDIGADAAWDQSTGSPSVRVAVIDTGINPDHEDFGPNRVRLGPDFVNSGGLAVDDNGHGTSVAGIAAALGNNTTGVAGVAWHVQPWAVKVLDWLGGGYATDLSSAIIWVSDQGIPILNMSLGWAEGSPELGPGGHNLLADVTLEAFRRGCFLVASAGNTEEGYEFEACPADLDRRVYAVGAFLPNGQRWQDGAELFADCSFDPCMASNKGGFLDVMAPGGRLITTTGLLPAEYRELSGCVQYDRSTMAFGGTSAAAPFVSGIAGLLLHRRPELQGEDIAQILIRTTLGPYPPGTWNDEYGWGRVRAISALNFVGPGKIVAHWGAGGGPFSLGQLQVTDSAEVNVVTFRDVPGMPSSYYTTRAVRYRLTANLTWPFSFSPQVTGWTRSSGTLGWKRLNSLDVYDHRVQVDTATFVPGTFGTAGVTVETYAYRVLNAQDYSQTVGWFPVPPDDARVALTVVGVPSGTTDVSTDRVAARLAVTTTPNPSRGGVRFAIEVPSRGHVRAAIYDLAGRRVANLAARDLEAGLHEFVWAGDREGGGRCPAGVYFCRVDCGGISTMTRFVRLGSGGGQ